MSDVPQLLRIPKTLRTVEDVLETAKKMNLGHVMVISETEAGGVVCLHSNLTAAEINWLADKVKMLTIMPQQFQRDGD